MWYNLYLEIVGFKKKYDKKIISGFSAFLKLFITLQKKKKKKK